MDIVPNILLAILYTILGVLFPDDVEKYYHPIRRNWWRIVIEIVVLALFLNEVKKEILEFISSTYRYSNWTEWRTKEIKRDLEYCHPQWPQEKAFVERQVQTAHGQRTSTYFQDVWNYLDCIMYVMLTVVFMSHFVNVFVRSNAFNKTVIEILSCTLVIVWIRMLKYARPFPKQGPFVVILDHIIADTFTWSFIFIMIYIPYAAAFYMNFGRIEEPVQGYENLSVLMFTMLRFALVDSYQFKFLEKSSPTMARILCSTYLVIGAIILMNMFIALMSNTFQRVYDNATATAAMQRARLIQAVEPDYMRKVVKYREFINSSCCPEQRDYLVIISEEEDQNRKQEEKISRLHSIINLRLGGKKFGKLDKSEFEIALEDIDSLKGSVVKMHYSINVLAQRLEEVAVSILDNVEGLKVSQDQSISELRLAGERNFEELKRIHNANNEDVKVFQAQKVEKLAVFHAESMGELKLAQAEKAGELKLCQARNIEELKVLQAEGVEEIKLQQALRFEDLKLTQVQSGEELKDPQTQNCQSFKRLHPQQDLKPSQLQMVENLKLAKQQNFQDLTLSREQSFEKIRLFQATKFENLKLSKEGEFKKLAISHEEKFEELRRIHAQEFSEQCLPKIQKSVRTEAVQSVLNPSVDRFSAFCYQDAALQDLEKVCQIQNSTLEAIKSSQTRHIEDLKHFEATQIETLRCSQDERIAELKQPEKDIASLSAKYERLEKDRERVNLEEKSISNLRKLYGAKQGVNKMKEYRRSPKTNIERSEQTQENAKVVEEERPEGENESFPSAERRMVETEPLGDLRKRYGEKRAEKKMREPSEECRSAQTCEQEEQENGNSNEELYEVNNKASVGASSVGKHENETEQVIEEEKDIVGLKNVSEVEESIEEPKDSKKNDQEKEEQNPKTREEECSKEEQCESKSRAFHGKTSGKQENEKEYIPTKANHVVERYGLQKPMKKMVEPTEECRSAQTFGQEKHENGNSNEELSEVNNKVSVGASSARKHGNETEQVLEDEKDVVGLKRVSEVKESVEEPKDSKKNDQEKEEQNPKTREEECSKEEQCESKSRAFHGKISVKQENGKEYIPVNANQVAEPYRVQMGMQEMDEFKEDSASANKSDQEEKEGKKARGKWMQMKKKRNLKASAPKTTTNHSLMPSPREQERPLSEKKYIDGLRTLYGVNADVQRRRVSKEM